jgi:hypothetical protein
MLRAYKGPRNRLSDRSERKSQNLQQIPDSFSKPPTFVKSESSVGIIGDS